MAAEIFGQDWTVGRFCTTEVFRCDRSELVTGDTWLLAKRWTYDANQHKRVTTAEWSILTVTFRFVLTQSLLSAFSGAFNCFRQSSSAVMWPRVKNICQRWKPFGTARWRKPVKNQLWCSMGSTLRRGFRASVIGGVAVQQVDRCESKRMSFSLSAIFFSYGVDERGTGCLSTCGHDGCLSPDEDDSSSLTFIIKHHSEAAKLSAGVRLCISLRG